MSRYCLTKLVYYFSDFTIQVQPHAFDPIGPKSKLVVTVKLYKNRNEHSRCVFLSILILSVSFCPPELPVGSCLRTLLPGSITVKQMPGQCADVSGLAE